MSVLVEYLAKFIKKEFISGVESSPESNFRMIFSAAPITYMSELYSFLTEDSESMSMQIDGEKIEIPVFLIDTGPHVGGRSGDPRVTATGLLKKRNSDVPFWLALQEVGAATSSSIVSTTDLAGISKEISEFSEWIDAPVIRYLVGEYFSNLKVDNKDHYELALKYALLQAWNVDYRYKDKRTVWRLLEKLLGNIIKDAPVYQLFSASLGLPFCVENNIGGKSHLKTLERVSDLFQSVGLRSGFDELENNATEDLLTHILAFRKHIEDQGVIEANEFTKSFLELCCPISSDSKTLPEWWLALNVEVWSELLSAGSDVDTPEAGVLEFTLSNPVTAVPKGMVPFVNKDVELRVLNNSESETIDFVIERSSGNAALEEIFRGRIGPDQPIFFEDNNAPDHDRFIRYKISAEGYVPLTIKVIVLDHYGPGVVALSSGSTKAKPFKINKKPKDAVNKKISRFECDLNLSGMGSHILDLYISQSAVLSGKIKGYEVDAEHTDPIERKVTKINANHYSCLIDTDEECHYELEAYSPVLDCNAIFRI
ncbi:MAG: hypothetical protein P8N58_06820, partial [Emcibacteraceae bacterium]|nr:hypothetical protein [Emcibacteraceae bacterium]